MRYVLPILLAVFAGTAAAPVVKPATIDVQRATQHAATLRLYFPTSKDKGALCSGTVIGPHRILTAEHCLFDRVTHVQRSKTILVDSRTGIIGRIERDGNDHLLLTVDLLFAVIAPLGAPMKQGDAVHWWGNPEGWPDIFRRGYVAGVINADDVKGGPVAVVDANVGQGDSGSGLFNERGQLIGVVTIAKQFLDGFAMLAFLPLNFTPEQWADP